MSPSFGMSHTPFAGDLPTECLFENPVMKDVLGRLLYVADKKLFAVVTADPGCGKSTLLRKFNDRLPKDEYILLYLSDSKLTPKWFYKGGCWNSSGWNPDSTESSKRQLQKAIEIIRGVQKKRVVCVLDEAHLLDKEMLEEFRFLLNYRFDSESPMALVLVGRTGSGIISLNFSGMQQYGRESICTARCLHWTGQTVKDTYRRIWGMPAAGRISSPTPPLTGCSRSPPVFRG